MQPSSSAIGDSFSATSSFSGRAGARGGSRRAIVVLSAIVLSAMVVGTLWVPGFASASVTAQPPAAAAGGVASIATVDVYRVAAKLVSTGAYTSRMEAKRDELRTRIAPMDNELRAITDKFKALGPDNKSPEAQQTAAAFEAKQQDIMKLSQGLDREMDTFVTAINYEAYLTVVKQAQALAKASGFGYLLASRPADDTTVPGSASAFMQSVMSRPVLLAPAGTDLTTELMTAMKLDEPPAPPASPAVPAAVPVPNAAPAADPAPAAAPKPM